MPSSRGNARAGLKTKGAAWQRAKEAADAFEATALGKREADAPGGAVRQERLLLDRLRNENHADDVGEAWIRIERYCKNGDEGQRVITRLIEAFTLSKNIALVPVDYRRTLKRLSHLKECADQLYTFFTDEIVRDPAWMIVAGSRLTNERDLKATVASLRHIQLLLTAAKKSSPIFLVI
jgi:hypothetical protein